MEAPLCAAAIDYLPLDALLIHMPPAISRC